MRNGTLLVALLVSTASTFTAYAVNPASKQYVDEQINQLDQKMESQIKIGQYAFDGVVYYVHTGSDGKQHGLVAATADESGLQHWNTAKSLCENKGWILPNQAQLTALYNNRYAIDPSAENGGFKNAPGDDESTYWSITTASGSTTNNAWFMEFDRGAQNEGPKLTSTYSVRCIKTF
jgi:hypothetical protein